MKNKTKRSVGRPRKGKNKLVKRSYYMTTADFEKLDKVAKKYSMTTPIFVRSILLREIH